MEYWDKLTEFSKVTIYYNFRYLVTFSIWRPSELISAEVSCGEWFCVRQVNCNMELSNNSIKALSVMFISHDKHFTLCLVSAKWCTIKENREIWLDVSFSCCWASAILTISHDQFAVSYSLEFETLPVLDPLSLALRNIWGRLFRSNNLWFIVYILHFFI